MEKPGQCPFFLLARSNVINILILQRGSSLHEIVKEISMAIPDVMKLVIAVGGIFGSFSYFALLQEDLFKKQYDGQKFKSTFFMMVAERGVNALVALVFLLVR
jgi:hypothetical protein